ncbi:MAG: hypothetical protein Q8L05_01625 [Actinomycetota bacterium]|nr:hypothetical protein [Actinomycetota bacterium]MDP2288072.1 hypothetical protein [Actinomycetota bacterium]
MPTVTDYYGIDRSVPFVNVDIAADNRLYVDPRAIRLRREPQPYAAAAIECADTFLREVTRCVIDGTPTEMARGEDLLQHFVEPWETRLGMAVEGFRGHGGAEVVGTRIWTALTDDVRALVRIGVLRQLEDLPLFVDGVDRDITSDVTTRIIFEPLARFTAAVIADYPEFSVGGHRVETFRRQVWDPAKCGWSEATVSLPVSGGRPLLLVPKGWARPSLLMSAGRYYETAVLSFAQLEQAVRAADGKLLTTPKDRLRDQPGLGRGRATNLRITMKALSDEQDLIAAFKRFVDERFDPDEVYGKSAA